MNKQFLLILVIGLLTSCQKFISENLVSDKRWHRETDYVASCRDKWTYGDLEQNLNVRILNFQLKSNHRLWQPSFFIGRTTEGDTIGLIDYDFDGTVAIGDTIEFFPGKSRTS